MLDLKKTKWKEQSILHDSFLFRNFSQHRHINNLVPYFLKMCDVKIILDLIIYLYIKNIIYTKNIFKNYVS